MSDTASRAFELLDPRIQRWIWNAQWTQLRDVQERAIPAILPADRDVILAAATAAGKTEAAFLPALTHMLSHGEDIGTILYVSPLKALINDQFMRLQQLCDMLEIPVWPWHGDVSASRKTRFFKKPAGVVLITPESLEAMMCNRSHTVHTAFAGLRYVIIDELHAVIGSERGKQLQALLHRLDLAVGRVIPRIGLSATLGDMAQAGSFLRPGAGQNVNIIVAASGRAELRLQIKGYVEPVSKPGVKMKTAAPALAALPPPSAEYAAIVEQARASDTPVAYAGDDDDDDDQAEQTAFSCMSAIADHLFQHLRGSNNLIFPNSRSNVEQFTYLLRKRCQNASIPNEFWPHHGNLSRDLREETETALKDRSRCASAICTSTLELGIDIGAVKSVAQIGPPPSVASLRQRLGRSGRRDGEPAILRGYVIEQEIAERTHLLSEMRVNLFEFAAMISLLLDRWYEPPRPNGMHLSTLVQQILALISQRGGITAAAAFDVLCVRGPFGNIAKADFIELLRHLGQLDLIVQESSGLLLHGQRGEQLVGHYSFYAAFSTEDEYRVVSGNKTLGSVPVSSAVSAGDFILFAGRTWRVEQIDDKAKTMYVRRHRTGKAPPYLSARGQTHAGVRDRMRALYEDKAPLPFLDKTADRLLDEGRAAYKRCHLFENICLGSGHEWLLFTWLGDAANDALVAMLRQHGINAFNGGPAIEITVAASEPAQRLVEVLTDIARQPPAPPEQLLEGAANLEQEKWDWALPPALLMRSYASLRLDIAGAHAWVVEHVERVAAQLR